MSKAKDLLKKYAPCSGVKTIQEINDQFDYHDENPDNHPLDGKFVACGQDDSYNELENIYESKLKPYIDSGEITEQQAIDALCEACHKLSNPRKREDFYEFLSDRLGVKVEL